MWMGVWGGGEVKPGFTQSVSILMFKITGVSYFYKFPDDAGMSLKYQTPPTKSLSLKRQLLNHWKTLNILMWPSSESQSHKLAPAM
jgi:hypothetical protein